MTSSAERCGSSFGPDTSSRRCASRPDNPNADARSFRRPQFPKQQDQGLPGISCRRGPADLARTSSAGREARRCAPGPVRARGVAQHIVVTRHQLRDPIRQPEGRVGTGRALTRHCWATLGATVGPFTSTLQTDLPVVDDDQGPTSRPRPGGV
jgi:ribosomal protein S14